VRSELHSNDYLPSPLLGPFILTGSVDDNLPTIDGQDVGFVYESLLTHGDSDLYLFTVPNEPANAFIGNDPAADVAVFQVRSPDQGVKFWRRVSNAQVRGEMVLELGLPGRSFSLGPDVNIDTFIIEVPCRAIRVYSAPGQGVHLAASGGYVGGDVEVELYRFGAGELTVSWDDIRYPWVGYAEPPDVGRVAESLFTDPALRDAFFPLCRIAQKFATSHRSNRPFWGPVHLESSFMKQRRSGNQLDVIMSWLIDQSVIFIRSRNYFLDSRRLYEEFRVWLFDLCARKETLEAFRLLERIVYGAGPG
jgi:hypothetical protein